MFRFRPSFAFKKSVSSCSVACASFANLLLVSRIIVISTVTNVVRIVTISNIICVSTSSSVRLSGAYF